MKMLVVVASRHGGSRGIGERIGEVLRGEGIDASVVSPDDATEPQTADGFVIGSGVYMGSWLNDGVEFIEKHLMLLSTRPVWLFSSGPLKGSTVAKHAVDPITDALGPEEGPGSGGRKRIEALGAVIRPRGHEVFFGAYDPADPPKAIAERFVRMMPMSKGILPPGDFRDWDAIEAWAHGIAKEMLALVPA